MLVAKLLLAGGLAKNKGRMFNLNLNRCAL
jgi:hypothetical protein